MKQKIDVLNRDTFVTEVINILETLSSNNTGCCFAIDGKWGSGKTFVLDMLKEQIRDITSEETSDNKYFLFNYNCWKYDYYEEPSIAIVSSIMDSIDEEFKAFSVESDEKISSAWKVAKQNIGKIAGKFIENHIGINVVEVYNDIKDEYDNSQKQKREFDSLFSFTQTLESTRELLQEIAQEKTFILMVDELDRCIPSYAIKVLERLHHIFDGIDNAIIIIAIDKTQLEHSIKQIYGESMDIESYLKKFINFEKKLPIPDINSEAIIESKYKSYFSNFNIDSEFKSKFNEIFSIIWKNINIREQEKALYKAEMIHNLICGSQTDTDPALLLFEVFVVRYERCMDNKDLQWMAKLIVSDINNISRFFNNEYAVNKNELFYLRKLFTEHTIATPDEIKMFKTGKNRLTATHSTIGKTLWLLSEVYNDDKIFRGHEKTLQSILSLAQDFETIIDFIS